MKVAYFGGDWFLSCLNAFELAGHQITHVFSHGETHYNVQLRQWATERNTMLQTTRPKEADLTNLINQRVDCLFSIEYPWLIPAGNLTCKTMNVHPSMLPHGRGPTPVSWIVHSYSQYAGVSFHTLSSEFDTGDIIYQEPITVQSTDTVDTVLAKLEIEIPRMLTTILSDFDGYYDSAQPQSEGSYWPKIELSDRTIKWTSSCAEIRKICRASGQFGVAIAIEDTLYLVRHMQCTEHSHHLQPGIVFKEDPRQFCITTSDGICVVDKNAIIESQALKQ